MNRISKDIFDRQNLPGLVATQGAACKMYFYGKLIGFAKFLICIIVPVILNVFFLIFHDSNGLFIATSTMTIAAFIIGKFLNISINSFKLKGAQLQEYFDEVVFEIHGLSTKRMQIMPMDRSQRMSIIGKYKNKNIEKFKDWYSDFSKLPYEKAVFECQKQNIRWDIKERKCYNALTIGILLSLFVPLVITAIILNSNMLSIISVIIILVPFVDVCHDSLANINHDINHQKYLYRAMETITKRINQSNLSITDLEEFQVVIFEYRIGAYLIPEFFHKIVRKHIQNEEDIISREIINEAKTVDILDEIDNN